MRTSKSTNRNHLKIAITTGDTNGIGFEVSAKALAAIGPKPNTFFFLYRDHKQHLRQPKLFKLIDQKFLRLTFESEEAALGFFNSLSVENKLPKNVLFDLALNSNPATWVLDAAKSCIKKNITSLVTGPISKTSIKEAGYSFMGHTGAFKSLLPKANLHMAFVGSHFNVLLATDHISLSTVSSQLNQKILKSSFEAAKNLQQLLKSKKDIAVLGLNPHAGERGMLGDFEKKHLAKLPKNFTGPLVPDAAFLKKNWSKYSLFLCLYHDQGLIPFKMIHGQDSGVHITMGLPFVRTSVDHGTAFDLYNKNLANPASMLEAISLNLNLIRR